MIALKSLKYAILDYCITVLFDRISKSFHKFSGSQIIKVSDIKTGMSFKLLQEIGPRGNLDKSWIDVRIVGVKEIAYGLASKPVHVIILEMEFREAPHTTAKFATHRFLRDEPILVVY